MQCIICPFKIHQIVFYFVNKMDAISKLFHCFSTTLAKTDEIDMGQSFRNR